MIFNMSGGGGSNAGLNFKVVGGNKAPVSPSENTIWVSNPNLFDFNKWAENTEIIANGSATNLSSSYDAGNSSITLTCTYPAGGGMGDYIYTDYQENEYAKIPCIAGKTYIIEWEYLENVNGAGKVYCCDLVPSVNSTKQVNANEGRMEYVPYEGAEFFLISLRISDNVISSTEKTVSGTFSNIRIVEEFTPITEWKMASENPYVHEVETNFVDGKITTNGYIGQYGDIIGQSTTYKQVYIADYIPVKHGRTYTYRYTIASSKSMWLAIVEYTKDHTFSKRIVPVDSVTGTEQTGTYTPSSMDIVEVILTWQTFGLETSVEFKGLEEIVDASDGAVWIHTNINSDMGFNALKKNDLEVYPVRAKQYVNGSWKGLTGYSYQNGSWKQWLPYGALYWYGNLCEGETGGDWISKKVKPNNETADEYDLPTATYENDYMLINWAIAGWGGGAMKIATFQDLTNVSLLQLEFEAELLQNPAQLYMSVYSKESVYHSDSVATVQLIHKDGGAPQTINRRTVTLDVSSLTGNHGIRFYGWDSWSSTNSKINLKVYSLRKIYNE